jgi:hypothetical protein
MERIFLKLRWSATKSSTIQYESETMSSDTTSSRQSTGLEHEQKEKDSTGSDNAILLQIQNEFSFLIYVL